MKYVVGINQKIILYTARFSSRLGSFLCKNNIHNVVNGIADHNTKPTASGIYGHRALFVEVLLNISSLYSILLALDTRYGDKIIVASSRKTPPGIKSIASCAINTGIDGSVKNIRFQKLSLFNLALIKLCIIIRDFINVFNFDDIKHLVKKLDFFRSLVEFVNNLVKYIENLLHSAIKRRR